MLLVEGRSNDPRAHTSRVILRKMRAVASSCYYQSRHFVVLSKYPGVTEGIGVPAAFEKYKSKAIQTYLKGNSASRMELRDGIQYFNPDDFLTHHYLPPPVVSTDPRMINHSPSHQESSETVIYRSFCC